MAFDLDGTLLRGETACEVVARRIGRLPRMAELESSSTVGQVVAAREEMASWYASYHLDELRSFVTDARLAPGTEVACRFLRERGIDVVIASVTWGFAVEVFAQRLGASEWLGTGLSREGEVTHVWPEDKATWLAEVCARRGITRAETAAVGDSAGDVPLLGSVAYPVFVGQHLIDGLPPTTVHLPAGDMHEVVHAITGVRPANKTSGRSV